MSESRSGSVSELSVSESARIGSVSGIRSVSGSVSGPFMLTLPLTLPLTLLRL